jgi:predicted Zn-ribbon and HTH transcriptional regulator
MGRQDDDTDTGPPPGVAPGPPLYGWNGFFEEGDDGRIYRGGKLREAWDPADTATRHTITWGLRKAKRRATEIRSREFLDKRRTVAHWGKDAARAVRRADLEAALHPVTCANCGNWFPAARADTLTCSPRCRTALYRKRARALKADAPG